MTCYTVVMPENVQEKEIQKEVHSEMMREIIKKRNNAFARFPLIFTLLGAFGLVSTFYGFQHLIDKIPLLSNNPLIALATGLVILILTGSLYKKLG